MLVSEIERRSGLSRDTIRYYEQIGLLPPVPRSGNGYRNYSALTLEQLKFIRVAQQIGFSLDQVRVALPHLGEPGKPCAEVMAALQAQRAAILARIMPGSVPPILHMPGSVPPILHSLSNQIDEVVSECWH